MTTSNSSIEQYAAQPLNKDIAAMKRSANAKHQAASGLFEPRRHAW
jgi:hypothetical protein